jgi:hypothetical protein
MGSGHYDAKDNVLEVFTVIMLIPGAVIGHVAGWGNPVCVFMLVAGGIAATCLLAATAPVMCGAVSTFLSKRGTALLCWGVGLGLVGALETLVYQYFCLLLFAIILLGVGASLKLAGSVLRFASGVASIRADNGVINDIDD